MTDLIATLDMYDWPEVAGETDAFWATVREHLEAAGISAPIGLDRSRPGSELWSDPRLLLGQTCGFPLVLGRCGDAQAVARGSYDVQGCGDGTYRSALLVRRDAGGDKLSDFRGQRVAINDWDSQSGVNTLRDALRPVAVPGEPFFSEVLISGGHRFSARAVAEEKADLAAIDAVAWHLFRRFEPGAARSLRVLGWTEAAPTLPFITSADHASMAGALKDALAVAVSKLRGKVPSGATPVAIRSAARADYASVQTMFETGQWVALGP